MVVVNTPASVIIKNDLTWTLDMSTVKATYTNVYTSVETAGCTGGGSNEGQPCNESNRPTQPDFTASQTEFDNFFTSQTNEAAIKCSTWNGGAMPSGTYTVTLTKTGTNGSGNFKWTATYTISTRTTPVLAHTYWTSTTTTSNSHDLTPIGFAAAASYMSSSKTQKFSFTLTDSVSATRVTGTSLALQELKSDGTWLTIATNVLGDLPWDSADASDCL